MPFVEAMMTASPYEVRYGVLPSLRSHVRLQSRSSVGREEAEWLLARNDYLNQLLIEQGKQLRDQSISFARRMESILHSEDALKRQNQHLMIENHKLELAISQVNHTLSTERYKHMADDNALKVQAELISSLHRDLSNQQECNRLTQDQLARFIQVGDAVARGLDPAEAAKIWNQIRDQYEGSKTSETTLHGGSKSSIFKLKKSTHLWDSSESKGMTTDALVPSSQRGDEDGRSSPISSHGPPEVGPFEMSASPVSSSFGEKALTNPRTVSKPTRWGDCAERKHPAKRYHDDILRKERFTKKSRHDSDPHLILSAGIDESV